jgi:hypothetical protein
MAMKKKETDPVLGALQKASKGLQLPSESDAPLEPFVWKDGNELTHDHLLQLSGSAAGTAVEERSLDNLLRTVPSEDKGKFQSLAKVLKEQLSDVKVYVVGDEAEKEVYLVGKTPSGQWAGLKSSVVET